MPAIEAWRANHRATFGTEIIDVPLETWPEHFPNVAQAAHLVRSGVREPLYATLTRIGTVEGFGANIRFLQPGDMQKHFVEDVKGTAIDHLGRGLFEAHGRDEAGWEEEAGHKDMWFAARDIAFEGVNVEIDIERCSPAWGSAQPGSGTPPILERVLPTDIDMNLELIASLMIRVLLIEVQAFHTFAWAEEWMSDPDLVAGDGEAAPTRQLHPRRRDAARRLPRHDHHRDARPHLDRHVRQALPRHRHDRPDLEAQPRPVARRAAPRRPGPPFSARSSTGPASTATPPRSSRVSTRWATPATKPPDR